LLILDDLVFLCYNIKMDPSAKEALTEMGRIQVVAEFEDQARTAAIDYGYDNGKMSRFMTVRGLMAQAAISEYGVTDVEEITEEMIQEIAKEASPMLQQTLSDNENERRKYKRIAQIDTLTGLGSRYAFESAKTTAEADDNVVFLKFDADNFGKINKELGDDAGDEALKDLAKHIQTVAEEYGYGERTFRLEDTEDEEDDDSKNTFRVGGDEFCILVGADVAEELMEEIIRTYGKENNGSQQYGSTIVSLTGGLGQTLKKANQELKKAKATKKQAEL
jgi:GGDEF domain-containing protein